MLIAEIIRKKRDGVRLAEGEISAMVDGISEGGASDAQVAAFAMAVLLNGMDAREAANLTLSMRDSGDVMRWDDLPGPVVDKHSTGGVGDNVSLMLAPIVAACGAYVPMISGRGLGHTGGTLDKMDAISGYSTQPDKEIFDRTVRDIGCAIIGQTGKIAPADKRLYAIRDVTATVESIPLITASILSKKLAAGLGALVMDVKFGNGAFMPSIEDARILARSITEVAGEAGLPCNALLTDMNQPLADAAGNAVEVQNAVDFLMGTRRDERLMDVVIALCGEMLLTAGIRRDRDTARAMARQALDDGRAAERFAKMVAALGGPVDFVEQPDKYLSKAAVVRDIVALETGIITSIATRDIGLAVVELGGGRRRADDLIDPSVGLTNLAPLGGRVNAGDPIAVVHAADIAAAEQATARVQSAYVLGGNAPDTTPIAEIIEAKR